MILPTKCREIKGQTSLDLNKELMFKGRDMMWHVLL